MCMSKEGNKFCYNSNLAQIQYKLKLISEILYQLSLMTQECMTCLSHKTNEHLTKLIHKYYVLNLK